MSVPIDSQELATPRLSGESQGIHSGSSKGRIRGLDSLRGLAAFGVMLFHYSFMYDVQYGFKEARTFQFGKGVYGVQLFFLISGFVIFMTVEKTRRPIDFVITRFARLYPSYWLALTLTTLAVIFWPGPEMSSIGLGRLARRAIANLMMFQGWFGVTPIDGVYWTLQIELTFYVIMFLLLCTKNLDKTVLVLTALVFLGVVQSLCSPWFNHSWAGRVRSILALDYLHILLIGVLLFQLRRGFRLDYLVLIALLILVPFSQRRVYQNPPEEVLVTAVFTVIVFLATTNRLPWLEHKSLVFLGTISYTLYLIHNEIGQRLIYMLDRRHVNHDLAIVVTIVSIIVLASAMSFLVEQPAIRVIRQLTGRSNRSDKVDDSPTVIAPGTSPSQTVG